MAHFLLGREIEQDLKRENIEWGPEQGGNVCFPFNLFAYLRRSSGGLKNKKQMHS